MIDRIDARFLAFVQITDGQITDGQITDVQITDVQITDGQITDGQITEAQIIEAELTGRCEASFPDDREHRLLHIHGR